MLEGHLQSFLLTKNNFLPNFLKVLTFWLQGLKEVFLYTIFLYLKKGYLLYEVSGLVFLIKNRSAILIFGLIR